MPLRNDDINKVATPIGSTWVISKNVSVITKNVAGILYKPPQNAPIKQSHFNWNETMHEIQRSNNHYSKKFFWDMEKGRREEGEAKKNKFPFAFGL